MLCARVIFNLINFKRLLFFFFLNQIRENKIKHKETKKHTNIMFVSARLVASSHIRVAAGNSIYSMHVTCGYS